MWVVKVRHVKNGTKNGINIVTLPHQIIRPMVERGVTHLRLEQLSPDRVLLITIEPRAG